MNIVGKYRDDVRFLHLERSIKCQYALFLKHLSNIFFECRVELKKAVKQLVIPMYLACNILISRMSLSYKNTISWRHYGAACIYTSSMHIKYASIHICILYHQIHGEVGDSIAPRFKQFNTQVF